MERGSDKHSPRQDDALAHEVEGMLRGGHATHAQEWADPEPSGEDQPDVDRSPEGELEGGVPDGMDAADVEGRSEMARHLGRIYPASRDELVARATENQAPDAVLRRLGELPADRTYANVAEVWTALGGGVEEHRA